MSGRRIFVIVVILAQLAVVASLIARQEYRWRTWTPIRLRVAPVDPVSLFRGRYVQLGYDFLQFRVPSTEWKWGETVYIRLAPDESGEFWEMVEVGPSLEPEEGSVLVRGEMRGPGYTVSMSTPINSYFVSERQAPELERLPRDKYELTVDVVVSEDGEAALKQLYVNGVRAEEFDPRVKGN
ncbi:MAG: GDYXXLXY domain-containing protein [Candidatus Acidoferrales bacterium]